MSVNLVGRITSMEAGTLPNGLTEERMTIEFPNLPGEVNEIELSEFVYSLQTSAMSRVAYNLPVAEQDRINNEIRDNNNHLPTGVRLLLLERASILENQDREPCIHPECGRPRFNNHVCCREHAPDDRHLPAHSQIALINWLRDHLARTKTRIPSSQQQSEAMFKAAHLGLSTERAAVIARREREAQRQKAERLLAEVEARNKTIEDKERREFERLFAKYGKKEPIDIRPGRRLDL